MSAALTVLVGVGVAEVGAVAEVAAAAAVRSVEMPRNAYLNKNINTYKASSSLDASSKFCKYLLWKFMTVREWMEVLSKLLLLLLQLLLHRLIGLTIIFPLSLCRFSFWSITNSSCLEKKKHVHDI
jgi:hypothetical protein